MKVVQCPQEYLLKGNEVGVFLAGGITGCPGWQDELIAILAGFPVHADTVVFNPRRDDFTGVSEDEQVGWERAYLQQAQQISFWFPKETVCPITLYELGYWLRNSNYPILLGMHPEYPKFSTVVAQIKSDFAHTYARTPTHVTDLHALGELIRQSVANIKGTR